MGTQADSIWKPDLLKPRWLPRLITENRHFSIVLRKNTNRLRLGYIYHFLIKVYAVVIQFTISMFTLKKTWMMGKTFFKSHWLSLPELLRLSWNTFLPDLTTSVENHNCQLLVPGKQQCHSTNYNRKVRKWFHHPWSTVYRHCNLIIVWYTYWFVNSIQVLKVRKVSTLSSTCLWSSWVSFLWANFATPCIDNLYLYSGYHTNLVSIQQTLGWGVPKLIFQPRSNHFVVHVVDGMIFRIVWKIKKNVFEWAISFLYKCKFLNSYSRGSILK